MINSLLAGAVFASAAASAIAARKSIGGKSGSDFGVIGAFRKELKSSSIDDPAGGGRTIDASSGCPTRAFAAAGAVSGAAENMGGSDGASSADSGNHVWPQLEQRTIRPGFARSVELTVQRVSQEGQVSIIAFLPDFGCVSYTNRRT